MISINNQSVVFHPVHSNTLKSVICGQLVSVLMCGTAYCLHTIKSVHRSRAGKEDGTLAGAPATGNSVTSGGNVSNLSAALVFPTYVIMFLIFTPFLACRRGENSLLNVVRGRGVKYFVVAAIDVEAKYLIIHAYKYTTLPSVQVRVTFIMHFRAVNVTYLYHLGSS